jgi:hypothetical protein
MASTLAQLTLSVEHANVGVDAEVMPTKTGENKELHHMLTCDYTQVPIPEPIFVTIAELGRWLLGDDFDDLQARIDALPRNTFLAYAIFVPTEGTIDSPADVRYFTGSELIEVGRNQSVFCGPSARGTMAIAEQSLTEDFEEFVDRPQSATAGLSLAA